jgi:hypothetical protein
VVVIVVVFKSACALSASLHPLALPTGYS